MGLYDGLQEVPTSAPPPAAPKAPASLYEGLTEVSAPANTPKEAVGFTEAVQAGLQGSAPGLAWRGKLPDLVLNPESARWWERAAAGVAQIGAELPLMIGGAIAGAPAGAALGTAVAPGAGTAAGTLLGAGFGMGVVPGGIRESLLQAYKSGEARTVADWFNIVREIAKTATKEGAINAAAMGAGAVAGRALGSALAPSVGTKITGKAAAGAIEAADIATQIAAMPSMPAFIEGRLPNAHEFLDAAVIIGGLKGAHVTAAKVVHIYRTTGKTPAEQVADAKADGKVAEDIATEPITPTKEAPRVFTPEEIAAGKEAAATRLEELRVKAEATPLTDAERAERVFLTNATPETTAARFAPAVDRAAHEASSQRVYDDVYRQLQEVDRVRQAAGHEPLGDDHAAAVAALVRARVLSRAERLGTTPEALYNERPLEIRDEAARTLERGAEPASTPPEAPAVAPEVDLFGEPILPVTLEPHPLGNLTTVETPIDNLILSKEVPQFKNAANAEGVVVALGGKFDRTGVGPIQVWERNDGTMEVISGRHRLDLAKRSGETTIPAQIHREADGFTAREAATLDAQLNIREEQGSIADYAQYFKDSGISREAADKLGLLARAKGRTGFAIARDGSPDLTAAHRAGLLSDEAALSISTTAPGSERLQALGIAMVNEGKSILVAVNTMRAVELMAAERMATGTQGDIFGFDDSAMLEAAAMAKKASSQQRQIAEQISAVQGASKRPALAAKMGVDVHDPEGIRNKIIELKQEQERWDRWPMHPELVAKLRELNQEALDKRSPEFMAWFEGSSITDGNGEPELAVHLTNADISQFDHDIQRQTQRRQEGYTTEFGRDYVFPEKGFFFFVGEQPPNVANKSTAIPVYLAIKNPLDLRARISPVDASKIIDLLQEKNNQEATPGEAGYKVRGDLVGGLRNARKNGMEPEQLWALLNTNAYTSRGRIWDQILDRLGKDGLLMHANSSGTSLLEPLRGRGDGATYTVAVALDPTQIKSAIGNRGTYDPTDPNILHQNEALNLPETPAEATARDQEALAQTARKLGLEYPADAKNTLFQDEIAPRWYSALGRQLEAVNMKQAAAKGWKDWLKGLPAKGVKADEIKWSGLEEWLDLQEGKVTKEQVQQFLDGNGVKVTEVMMGGADDVNVEADRQSERALIAFEEYNRRYSQLTPEQRARVDEIEETQRGIEGTQMEDDDAPGTKFSQYALPGAKEGSYRELLLTLPEKPHGPGKFPTYEEWLPQQPWYDTWHTYGADEVKARRLYQEWFDRGGYPSARPAFRSGHFDQPNILAHVRFNERTDADGKRVLFVEEIQSDWAQKGKKEGFAFPPERRAELDKRRQELEALGRDATLEQKQEWVTVMNELQPHKPHDIPQAPFVGKTDAWVGLVLKRMIRHAAENGFDRIAWTNGEQQVGRYTRALRHAVDEIEWKKTPEGVQLVGYKGSPKLGRLPEPVQNIQRHVNSILTTNDDFGFDTSHEARQAILRHDDWDLRWGDGLSNADIESIDYWRTRRLAIEATGGRTKVVDTTEKEDALSDAIGKAMAQRIIDDPNQTGTIAGDNIKIDDTGMASFYDRIVPNVAKDILKKLGGGKVVNGDIGSTGGRYVVEPIEQVNRFRVVDYGEDSRGSGVFVTEPLTYEAAQAWVSDKQPPSKQQGFDITPAMRAKALEGMPLFQQHRGSYRIAENLITTMQGADKSTVVHELSHSWLEEMKADAARADAPQQIKNDWETLRKEFAIGEAGDIPRASHETFARTFERYMGEGDAPSGALRHVFERFKNWILEIYQALANIPGARDKINPELRGVLDRMLATDAEIAEARALGVPRAYVPEAKAEIGRKIVPGFIAEQAGMFPYADEIPKGPGEAPDNTHVNYAYINTPADVKLAMQRLAELDQENIQKHRGGTAGVKSWAEANAEQAKYLNDILGGSEDTLRLFEPADPDAPKIDAKLGIMKKLMVGAAQDSARLRDTILQKGHDATVREQLEYLGSIERARMIQAEFLGERAAVARALNALKDTTEGSGEIARMLEAIGYGEDAELHQRAYSEAELRAMSEAEQQQYMKAKLDEILLGYKGKTVLDIAKLHKEVGTLKGTFEFAKAQTEATKWEMVIEGWRSGLLSGPVTHTTNLFGTGAFMALRAPVDALAAIIGTARGASPGMGESDRASMSEAVARISGMLGGIQEGFKVARATFDLDDPTGKTEAYRTAIPGRAGELIRIPLRLMGAEDALVSTMYLRGELRTLAMRQAFDEGMNPSTREFAERVTHLVDNPTTAMADAADAAATRMTFNSPLGEKGIALQQFVQKWNLQWMVPFIRTPINIAKELGRMSAFAPVVGEWRADFAAGGVARDRAIAEMALGSGIMALTMAYAFAGNVSGAGSPEPGKNRAKVGTWQPYSVLIGDTWYEYARLAPTGTLIGMAADIAAVWDHMTDEEKDKTPKMLAVAFSNAVTNQTFLQGITNFVNATSDPTRFAPRFIQQLAASLVPNIIAQPTAMADPVVREVNSVLEAVQARIPGVRQDLLPKRDWLGETVKTKERPAIIMPSREQKVSDDKVRLEADRLNISVAAPPKTTHIGRSTGKIGQVDLTPEEQDKFEQVSGQMAHQILGNIVTSPGYDQIPDMIKRRIFSKVLTASHRVGAVMAIAPEKRATYLQQITERMQVELAPGE